LKAILKSQKVVELNKNKREVKRLVEEAKLDMKQIKKTLYQSFENVDELNCSICMDYIVSCRTAICGHSFCEECINESLIRKKECPNCRKDIRKWVLSKSEIIDSAVKLMVESKRDNGDDEDYKRRIERLKNHEKWLAKH